MARRKSKGAVCWPEFTIRLSPELNALLQAELSKQQEHEADCRREGVYAMPLEWTPERLIEAWVAQKLRPL